VLGFPEKPEDALKDFDGATPKRVK